MINFDYIRTSTAKAAVDAKAKNASSQFIAGGTNLVDLMKKGVTSPDKLIDINGLPLKQITADAKGVTIGALALNCDVAENAIIKTNGKEKWCLVFSKQYVQRKIYRLLL